MHRGLLAVALALAVAGCAQGPAPSPSAVSPSPVESGAPDQTVGPVASPATAPGHEIYGFVPYWEIDDTIAAHLAATPLTTVGLFSVTHTAKGAVNSGENGYKAITGDVGRTVISQAHDRGTRVEVVYTVFGSSKARKLFKSPELQATVIASLVTFLRDQGLDGVNVDVEGLDAGLVPAYASFVGDLRAAVQAADPSDQVSVATASGGMGAGMAAAAAVAGADRIFLMAYDYRVTASSPGATSPLENRDGPGEPSIRRSLDMYAALGVPSDRLLLGLPLYGLTWPVAGPVIGAPETGRGDHWILRSHVDVLGDPSIVPLRDATEVVDVYLFGSDGIVGPPPTADPSATPSAGPSVTASDRTWTAVYVDSPSTLATKMDLAEARGLAGVGFWAVGYERGLPGYTRVMTDWAARGAAGTGASGG